MDTREKISTALQASQFAPGQAATLAQELYDAVAGELAEKIRRLRDDCRYDPDDVHYRAMSGCANLIDPEWRP